MSPSTSRLGRFFDLLGVSGLPTTFLRLSPLLGVFGLLSGAAILFAANAVAVVVAVAGVAGTAAAVAAVASGISVPRFGRLLLGWSLACLLRVRMRDGDSSPRRSPPAVVEPLEEGGGSIYDKLHIVDSIIRLYNVNKIYVYLWYSSHCRLRWLRPPSANCCLPSISAMVERPVKHLILI